LPLTFRKSKKERKRKKGLELLPAFEIDPSQDGIKDETKILETNSRQQNFPRLFQVVESFLEK
jgi:hypothetical protein